MTYIQKDNIYTNIQEMLKCEVHLNNIEKQKAMLLWLYLGNSQVSVYRTIGRTLVVYFSGQY